MGKLVNLAGVIFGHWKVKHRAENNTVTGHPKWVCQCSCGIIREVSSINLRSGVSKSCGSCGNIRHGNAVRGEMTGAYRSWLKMRERVKNNPLYATRFICEAWESFENFLADMGERPPNLTLERVDNDLGYFPANCKWATRKEQANNRGTKKLFT